MKTQPSGGVCGQLGEKKEGPGWEDPEYQEQDRVS